MSGVFAVVRDQFVFMSRLNRSFSASRNLSQFSRFFARGLCRDYRVLDHSRKFNCGRVATVRPYWVLANRCEPIFVNQSAFRSDSLSANHISRYITNSQSASRFYCASSNQQALPDSVDNKGQRRFLLAFTCRVCDQRVEKTISRQAYCHGVVLVECDGCRNRHLIADRLGWFSDQSVDVESLLAARGEHVQRRAEGVHEVTGESSTLQLPQPSVTSPERADSEHSTDEPQGSTDIDTGNNNQV